MPKPSKSTREKLAAGTLRGRRPPRDDLARYPVQGGIHEALRELQAGGDSVRSLCVQHVLNERRVYGFLQGDCELMVFEIEALCRALDLVCCPLSWLRPEHVYPVDGDGGGDDPEGSGPPTGSPSVAAIASSEPT